MKDHSRKRIDVSPNISAIAILVEHAAWRFLTIKTNILVAYQMLQFPTSTLQTTT